MHDAATPPAITLYGIPNCDSVKKARAWLSEHGLAYTFHDFKKQGVPPEQLSHWIASVGWEQLLNRKGTTWRRLDTAVQSAVSDLASARALMLAQPSVIKRPVIAWYYARGTQITVGFNPGEWPAR